MRITPKNELEYRYRRLQQEMAQSLDGVLILQNADLFYFAGTTQPGVLYVPAQGVPLYLVRKNYARARMESGLKEVVPCDSLTEFPRILAEFGYPAPSRIGMELDVLPVNLFERYRKLFPGAAFSDATPGIRRVRMIKTQYEIHILQDAALQMDRIYRRAKELVREGMTDLELAAELEMTARREGHQGLVRMRGFNSEVFFAQVLSGPDSAIPSGMDSPLGGLGLNPSFGQGASYNRIGRNEPIVVDFAACFDGYLVDQTRIFVVGEMPEPLAKAYEDMVRIQERMMAMAVDRPLWGEIYDECLELACSMGYRDNFMGAKGSQVSFIGHGIGIELNELPLIARGFHEERLEPGMVFAFEPKVVFPGTGAVGIENTFYLSDEGLKKLTVSPEEPVVVTCP